MATQQTGQKVFAAGRFYGIANIVAPTPTVFAIPQDQSITFKRGVKSLFGEKQIAADVAAGTMEVTGKVTLGTLQPRIFADLLFGDSGAAGQILEVNGEAGIVGSTPYQVTVANSATWTVDLGVRNVDTGKRYIRVASGPVAGTSYSVAAGIYQFAVGDAAANMKISYLYSSVSTGETIVLANQDMGCVGNFTGVMQFNGCNQQSILSLNKCLASDTELATKQDDFAKPTFGFMASCDDNDVLGSFSFAQAG